MDIESLVEMDHNMSDEMSFKTDIIGIVTCENPNLYAEDDEVYMGDNPDIFGIFIGKDHPLASKILQMIDEYDETENNEEDIIDIKCEE